MGLEQIRVDCVDHGGSDLSIVNAARQSFSKESEWAESPVWSINKETGQPVLERPGVLRPADERLINFLARGMSSDDFEDLVYELGGEDNQDRFKDMLWQWRHTPIHDTPTNHAWVSFRVKAPIFVARQLVKTEYMPFSEQSGRYIILDEFYEHDYRQQGENRKQGSLPDLHPNHGLWKRTAAFQKQQVLELYQSMVEAGVAIEQARGVLPVDTMTSWTWSGTLGAVAKMCRERLDSHAQAETRHVAGLVYDELKQRWPVSAPALVEGPR